MDIIKNILMSMTTVRLVLLVIEFMLLLWFVAAVPFVNAGTFFGMFSCICLISVNLRWDDFKAIINSICKTSAGKTAVIAVSVILAALVVYFIFLSVMMLKAISNKPQKPNVVVVLGCKVMGDKPSKMLCLRLDAAKVLLDEYSDVKCVVSGGKGNDEKISEAQAMKTYLIEKGISQERIIMEDRSTTTFENLRFTFEKLDSLGISRDITIVTDGYHQYRSSLIAKQQGAGEVTSCSANTEFKHWASHWLREWLGITKFYILGL